MSDAFLDKLYYPSGITDATGDRWARNAQLLAGLPETPGKLAEVECKRGELAPILNLADRIYEETGVDCRAPSGKVSSKCGLWKGSTTSTGEVSLPGDECLDTECTLPHAERFRYCRYHDCREAHKYHVVLYPARIYTHPSGAIAKVREDHE